MLPHCQYIDYVDYLHLFCSIYMYCTQIWKPHVRAFIYFQENMEDVRQISHGLYRVVGEKLGTEKIVDMRRRVMALEQNLNTRSTARTEIFEDKLFSGSKGEGLRFASSDEDWMLIHRDTRVIFSSKTEYQHNQTILLADQSSTRPGFVLLRRMNDTCSKFVALSTVPYENGFYVASENWRDNFTSLSHDLTTHGPCSTTIAGTTEIDYAVSIKADKLPQAAHCFVQRLHKAGWPSTSTLQKIVLGGCHFVAIGAKDSPTELIEWRISFSAIEKILVHSMNHVQFLCYGLLKIFLKEVIDVNIEIKGMLCSYYIKTALFWEICRCNIQWNTSNFLSCFWTCFQRLLHWINNEYCPNFFIPENNMFAGKVHGAARRKVISYLVPLYKEGYSCLLRCRSIQSELNDIIWQPTLVHIAESPDEQDKCDVEVRLINEIWNSRPDFCLVESEIAKQMEDLDSIIVINDCAFELEILQIWRNYLTQNDIISSWRSVANRISEVDQSGQPSTRTMPVVDATRHLLYTALYHYRRGMYSDAISLLQEAKVKLQHPHILYLGESNAIKYRAAGGEHRPLSHMIKEIVAFDVELNTDMTIPELTLEHQVAANFSSDMLVVPPLVFTNFMYYLCYRKMEKYQEAQSMLQELSILVQYDDGYHIYVSDKAMSWQILGICQEISGDHQGANISYFNALQQEWCPIGPASFVRMQNVIR